MSAFVLRDPEGPPAVAAAAAAARNRSRLELFMAAVLFGLVAVLTRRAALGGFGAGQLATLRFSVGALASVAYFAARKGSFVGARRMPLVVRGLAGGVAVVLYFVSLALIPAGEATLLNNLYPVLTTVLAIFTLGERPTIHLAGALALTTVGVVLVLGGDGLHMGFGWGELAGLLSSLFGAVAVAAIRAARLPGGDRPAANTVTVFFALTMGGLIVAWPFALQAWPTSGPLWGLALGAAFASLGAQLLMTHALGFLAIPEASIWQQLAPVMSFLWGAVLLAEPVSGATMAGVATAGLGVVYGAVLGRRSKQSL